MKQAAGGMHSEYKREVGRAREAAKADLCPLCGSRVTYRGFTSIECAGKGAAAREHYDPARRTWSTVPAAPDCKNYRIALEEVRYPGMELWFPGMFG